jgi:hypothetical protein
MKRTVIASFVVALLAAVAGPAQDAPKMPAPQKEHEWLRQFVGEWETELEMYMEPGKPPVKGKGTDKARRLGGFWVVTEGKSEVMGMSFDSILTLGYDPQKKKYVGTWVDSVNSYLWKFEGTVDSTGKVLTFEAEGPCPAAPEKLGKFKEVIEFKSQDHRVSASSMLGDDGKWITLSTASSLRKK